MKVIKVMLIGCFQLVLMSNSCKKDSSYYDYRLKIINKSNKTIYGDFYQSYPDTTLSLHSHFDNASEKAASNETITLVRGGSWDNAFKEEIHQKLMVFIFDAAVINTTPWDTIRKNYLILKRYDLTLEDLQKLNWSITYP